MMEKTPNQSMERTASRCAAKDELRIMKYEAKATLASARRGLSLSR
jgi:hypothetical protein